MHICTIICSSVLSALLLLQIHTGTQASRFHKSVSGNSVKGRSHRNNLALTLEEEIYNLSSKRGCSVVFWVFLQPGVQKAGITPPSSFTETAFLQRCSEREILCIFPQHLRSTVVEVHANMYLDCCEYIYIYVYI